MGHDHGDHHHSHGHHHHGDERAQPAEQPETNLGVPDEALEPSQVRRRSFLRSAGLLGAGAASVLGGSGAVRLPSAAATTGASNSMPVPKKGYRWLAGDHHTHTQYSPDGQYRVIDHVQHAAAYGLGWMVVTDHGTDQHAKIGVEKVNPDIRRARDAFGSETLVFQGLEWNIPAAEHGTVFVHPGPNEVDVLKRFENGYDGAVKNAGDNTPANEALAITGLNFLADELTKGSVADALMFANHPARKGIDSPHEIRGWRDAQPRIAVGMEGAPGHQAAGIPEPYGPGSGRGYYDNDPDPVKSFPGYPVESYRTYGGFDWMTSTVGGLWDSLLAEGKPWWITANSDSHMVYLDTSARGGNPETDFAAQGFYADPVHVTDPATKNGDFWPGYYSRTHVGAADYSYAAVMDALRGGRVWVDHGGLIESLDVRVRAGDQETTLGGVIVAPKGTKVSLVASLVPAQRPNFSQFVPQLTKVDLIRGVVTGPASDRDTFTAPQVKVTKTWDLSRQNNTPQMLTYDLGVVGDEGFYVRGRGSDGKRVGAGLNGAGVDPAGPVIDVVGDADPWDDLWFYTNPIWVLPA